MRISEIAEFWSSVSSNWNPEQNLFHEKYSFLWTVPFIKYLFAAIEIKEWAISLILSLAFDLFCCQERVPNLSTSPTSWPYLERRLRFSIGKNNLSQKISPNDNIIRDMNEKETEKSEIFIEKKD